MNEGVVKYKIEFKETPPLEPKLWEELEPLRSTLKKSGLIGVKSGVGYGNVSRRLKEGGFVITATQTGHLQELDGYGYSVVTGYDEERFCIRSYGAAKPSSEAFTHAAVYTLSEEIEWVVHIHSKPLWEMMLSNDEYLKSAPVEYGTKEMAKEVRAIYKEIDPLSKPLFAMAGHEEGIVLFAKSAEDAIEVTDKLLSDFNLV